MLRKLFRWRKAKDPSKKDTQATRSPLRDPSIPTKTKVYLVLKTLALSFSAVTIGTCYTNLGITLPDLLPRVQGNYETVARAMSFSSLASIGAFFLLTTCEKNPKWSNLLCAVGYSIFATFNAIIPFTKSTLVLGIVCFCRSIGSSIVYSLSRTIVTDMWKSHSSFPLHMVLVGYTIGGLVAPFITKQFLSPDRKLNNITDFNETFETSTLPTQNFTIMPNGELQRFDHSRIEIPYIIFSGFIALCAVLFVIFHFLEKNETTLEKKPKIKKTKDRSTKIGVLSRRLALLSPRRWANGDLKFGSLILLGLSVFLVGLAGHAEIIGLWGFSYAVDSELQFSKQEASYLMSVANLFRFIGRMVAGVVSLFVPIQVMFFVEVVVTLVTCALLSFCVTTQLSFWIVLCAYKAVSSAIWPTTFAWANQYIILTPVLSGMLGVITGVADLGVDNLVGYLLQNVSKISAMYLCLACATAGFLALIFMQVLGSFHGNRFDDIAKESPLTSTKYLESSERETIITDDTNTKKDLKTNESKV